MTVDTSPVLERVPDDFLHHPFELYARMRAEGPVHPVVMPHGSKVWMVTRYDDVRALLMDPRISKDGRRMNEMFARHAVTRDGADAQADGDAATADGDAHDSGFDDDLSAHMANSDPPRHTRLRTLVSKAFTTPRMENMRPRIVQVVDDLLDKMAERSEVDLIADYTMQLPVTIVFDLLGIPQEDRDKFRRWATRLIGTGHDPAEVAEASRQVVEYANALIDAKRANPDEFLVSALVRVTDGGDRLTQTELVAMIFILVIAGSETPMNQLGMSVYHLLTHPDQLAKLRSDPSKLPAAIEELMRYDGGVSTASFRFANADITVGNVVIPEGDMVLLVLGSANRDEAHFADPDVLDIDRHPVGSLAFGHGIHYCIGAPVARITMEVGLWRLIQRFPDLRLAVDADAVEWKTGNLMRGLARLPVTTTA
jgi:cytochrome P450